MVDLHVIFVNFLKINLIIQNIFFSINLKKISDVNSFVFV
jgi:hypothetical protein